MEGNVYHDSHVMLKTSASKRICHAFFVVIFTGLRQREKISAMNISAKLGAKDVQHSISLPRFTILCVIGWLSTAKGKTY